MKITTIIEAIKKSDIKSTERKMDKEIINKLDNNEIAFLNQFLKKGEMLDGKKYKSLDAILTKYKQTIGSGQVKNDPNLLMLAPILAAMITTIEHKK